MSTTRLVQRQRPSARRRVGSSLNSWEEAATAAVEEAAQHLEGLRVAEVELPSMRMMDNKVVEYRAQTQASFRYVQKNTNIG